AASSWIRRSQSIFLATSAPVETLTQFLPKQSSGPVIVPHSLPLYHQNGAADSTRSLVVRGLYSSWPSSFPLTLLIRSAIALRCNMPTRNAVAEFDAFCTASRGTRIHGRREHHG